jgi:hypothetical protein
MLSQAKLTKNYNSNIAQYDLAVRAFRKTDGMETLIEHLMALLTPDEFRMLSAIEISKIPLTLVYVDKDGNRIPEKVEA